MDLRTDTAGVLLRAGSLGVPLERELVEPGREACERQVGYGPVVVASRLLLGSSSRNENSPCFRGGSSGSKVGRRCLVDLFSHFSFGFILFFFFLLTGKPRHGDTKWLTQTTWLAS